MKMKLHFATNAHYMHRLSDGTYERRQSMVTLGTFKPVTLADLRAYVRKFPMAWVSAT